MQDDFITQEQCEEHYECEHDWRRVEDIGKRVVMVCDLCGDCLVDDYYGRGDEPQTVEPRE